MKENKVGEPRRPTAKGIVPKGRKGPKPRRAVAKGDVVIPKKGVWAGEDCVVLAVEKRPHPSGYFQLVRVLLPNQRQRWYPLTEIKEIIPAKGPILTQPPQKESDAKVPNEKLSMEVVVKPLIGTAEANLEQAKNELTRVLSFRGDVISAKVEGSKIVLQIVINPKWDAAFQVKVSYLKEWIPAKVRSFFEVISISEGEHK